MFHSSFMSVRTYAIRRPSDDTATGCPPANVRTASMSSVVKTGTAWATAFAATDNAITIVSSAVRRRMKASITVRLKPDTTAVMTSPRKREFGGLRALPRELRTELYTKRHARVCAGLVPRGVVHGVWQNAGAGGRRGEPVATTDRAHHHRHAAGGPARVVRIGARFDARARRVRARRDAVHRRGEPGSTDAAVACDHPHWPASCASRRSHQRRLPPAGVRADAGRIVEDARLRHGRVHRRLSAARIDLRPLAWIRSLRRRVSRCAGCERTTGGRGDPIRRRLDRTKRRQAVLRV